MSALLDRARFALDYVESAAEDTEATGDAARTRYAHEIRDEAREQYADANRADRADDAAALAEAVDELERLAARAADNAADARRLANG